MSVGSVRHRLSRGVHLFGERPWPNSGPSVNAERGGERSEPHWVCWRLSYLVTASSKPAKPSRGSQLALLNTYDYHAFITNRLGVAER